MRKDCLVNKDILFGFNIWLIFSSSIKCDMKPNRFHVAPVTKNLRLSSL